MTALRTTRPTVPRRVCVSARAWVVGVFAFGMFGCGTAAPPANDSAPQPSSLAVNEASRLADRDKLPPPDLDRIEYDSPKRTLTLYDLPGQDIWMVRLPDELTGRPVGPQHRLPEGVDTRRTLVYYVRPGVKTSAPLSVATIEAGRGGHTSLVLNR